MNYFPYFLKHEGIPLVECLSLCQSIHCIVSITHFINWFSPTSLQFCLQLLSHNPSSNCALFLPSPIGWFVSITWSSPPHLQLEWYDAPGSERDTSLSKIAHIHLFSCHGDWYYFVDVSGGFPPDLVGGRVLRPLDWFRRPSVLSPLRLALPTTLTSPHFVSLSLGCLALQHQR